MNENKIEKELLWRSYLFYIFSNRKKREGKRFELSGLSSLSYPQEWYCVQILLEIIMLLMLLFVTMLLLLLWLLTLLLLEGEFSKIIPSYTYDDRFESSGKFGIDKSA